MAYTINIGRRAQLRFIESLEYIAFELASPQAMRSLVSAFDDAIVAIKAFPDAYPANREATKALGFEVRRISVKNYGLFYRVVEGKAEVQVFSFLHSRQQVARNVYWDYMGSF